jgi:aspartate-semialdehyde dehydrogenase
LSDRITNPLYAGKKGWRAEDAALVGLRLGRFPNRALTVIVMMECCRIYNKLCVNYSIISHDQPVFNRFFHIYKIFWRNYKMKQFHVGIIGATGMVGQRFATLLAEHPWFNVKVLAASPRSAGKTYAEAVGSRWAMKVPMPESMKDMIIMDAQADIEKIASMVDFVFCAVDMKKDEIKALEEAYAKAECPVVSNNSAHRFTADVPMVVPEVNPEHIEIIKSQRERLGTKRGFIAVKSNCSIQSYVPALSPLRKFGIKNILACTYQAISGAGKTFETWPEMVDNVIPFIGGEEEKSEQEPLKVWGTIENGEIVKAQSPLITTQCLRVPVSDGHTAAVFVTFENKPSKEEILNIWKEFAGVPQELELPSAPKQFLNYFEEDNRPQAKSERNLEGGMAVSIGRLREDTLFDYKFVCLSHNTLRGAAGGAVLLAELLAAKGYFDKD